MGFTREVREEALTAAARHCCVCHRYKGVSIEVHHIVPKSEGGTDDLDNAIALCFDCHTHAGHYNPDHPKGTKFSPSELRKARDKWHSIVERRGLEGPTEQNNLNTRYLICQDVEIAEEILNRKFSRLPNIDHPLLVENEVGDFMSSVLNDSGPRHNSIQGKSYESIEEYESSYSDVRKLNQENGLEYFKATRLPSRKEIRDVVGPEDRISELLLQEGFPPEKVASPLVYWEVCGNTGLKEIYRLRPLWAVFLAAKNTTDGTLLLEELIAEEGGKDPSESTFLGEGEKELSIPLPEAPVPSGADVIIPAALLLGPFHHISPNNKFFEKRTRPKDGGRPQKSQFISYSKEQREKFRVWGASLYPKSFLIREGGVKIKEEVHELDLSRTFAIDRFWEAGSCPHLFFEVSSGHCIYWGELFAHEPETIIEEIVQVPDGAKKAIIAELEQETTHVVRANSEGDDIIENITLTEGQEIKFSVKPGEFLQIVGSYSPNNTSKLTPQPCRRNEVISTWIKNQSTEKFNAV